MEIFFYRYTKKDQEWKRLPPLAQANVQHVARRDFLRPLRKPGRTSCLNFNSFGYTQKKDK